MDEAETVPMDLGGGTIMSTAKLPGVAPLIAGQRLVRAVFHERYRFTPPGFRAELIGGVVVMPSPVGNRHGIVSAAALLWLGYYKSRTDGVEVCDNASTALDDLAEVQPDALLRIKPDRGGQSRNLDNIIEGAPELVVEVAQSSRAVDLGAKLADYERAGTLEYIVFAIDPDEIFWHARRDGRLVRVPPDPDGLYRSKAFPGLWLDPAALLADDGPAILATLERGLATEEHAAFVHRLANASR
jgi:Uma2 family endonuclease